MTKTEKLPVSCIIPTHSRPEFLRDALGSVVRQSAHPVEVLVVSDCEDPLSEALCNEVAAQVPFPVTFTINPGRGASSSRNLGAALSHGDFLAFLDDDDIWAPNYLEHALSSLLSSSSDLAVTWLRMFRGSETAPGVRIRPGLSEGDVGADNPGMTGSNVLISRAAFDDIGGFDVDLPVKNDGDFFFRLLLARKSYSVNAREEVLQRKHSGGQLTGRTTMRAAGLKLYLAKHRSRLSRADQRLILLSVQRILFHAAKSPWKKARYLVLGAFYSSPSSLMSSVRNRRTKSFWITSGFADLHEQAEARGD
jgi:glycosyltransferase involved in cell wall biosynthesis